MYSPTSTLHGVTPRLYAGANEIECLRKIPRCFLAHQAEIDHPDSPRSLGEVSAIDVWPDYCRIPWLSEEPMCFFRFEYKAYPYNGNPSK